MRKGSRALRSRPRYEARDSAGNVVLASFGRDEIVTRTVEYNAACFNAANRLTIHDTHDADEAIVPLPA